MAVIKAGRKAALKAWKTRRLIKLTPTDKAKIAEAASKEGLRRYCKAHRWQVGFFESPTGSPLTGIIDAIMFRLDRQNTDALEVRLIQLKGGGAGVSAREIKRLKRAAEGATVAWGVVEYDGKAVHLLEDWPDSD